MMTVFYHHSLFDHYPISLSMLVSFALYRRKISWVLAELFVDGCISTW